MLLAIHGAAGGWDELAIALVAFGVMWIAVKLAGRKPADGDDEEDDEREDEAGVVQPRAEQPAKQPTQAGPPAAPLV